MSSVHDNYVGFVAETTYGTAVLPTRFYEFISESLKGNYERVDSEALRAGTRVLRSDRFMPVAKGAEGDVKIECLDGGLGLLLKHAMGSVSTVGAADPYTHTFTVGDLRGLALTCQVGRVAVDGTLHPFTYEGGKIKTWELTNGVDGVLQFTADFDFEAETIGAGAGAYAAATPTYPAGVKLLTFDGGACTIGGTDFKINEVSIKGDNMLKVDRWFIGNAKKEPLEDGLREYTFEIKGEFDGLTQLNRVKSATAAGAVAALNLNWNSPVAGHSLQVDIAAARFDEGPVNAEGAKVIEHTLTGKVLYNGTDSAVEIIYASADATP